MSKVLKKQTFANQTNSKLIPKQNVFIQTNCIKKIQKKRRRKKHSEICDIFTKKKKWNKDTIVIELQCNKCANQNVAICNRKGGEST